MLYLIPPPLHRALYRLAWRLRTAWWRLAQPTVRGCRVIALDGEGRVLLVRQSYGSRAWTAPGGGMGRGDHDAIACAARELAEETGLVLGQARHVASLVEPLHGATNIVEVVAGKAAGPLQPDRREVDEARFFPLSGLPADISPRVAAGLGEWVRLWTVQSSVS